MRLFGRLLGRSSEEKTDNALSVNHADDETAPVVISRTIAQREYNLSKAVKIPFTEAILAGGTLTQMVSALKTFATGNQIGDGSLVRIVFPDDAKGRLVVDKSGQALATIRDGTGKFVDQARLKAVTPFPNIASLATQAAMAAILMEINQKLDTIRETQQRILDFLEQDKQAEQQANLNILTGIMDGYRYNWDNAQYLQNQHMKVLDIKQSAQKNIIFYQEQIATLVGKMPSLHFDQAVKDAIANLAKQFGNYRMALYLFSFASFMEVMLLGNFHQAYLEQVAAAVQEYNRHYQTQFSQCRDMIKEYSFASVETKVLEGIGNAGKAIGKFVGSVPILAKGPVDEWLSERGDRLLKSNDEKVARVAALFNNDEKLGSELFVDSIRNIGTISNRTTDLLFDKEALYLATA